MDDLKKIQDELKRAFGDYEFVEEGHYYLYKGVRVGISTTGLIGKYHEHFDADKQALITGARRRVDPKVLKEEWRLAGVHASIKGNRIHEYAQSLWLKEEYDLFDFSKVPKEVDLERLRNDLSNMKIQADKHYNDFKDRYELIWGEFDLGHPEYDECGAADIIFWDKVDKIISIEDYKSYKELSIKGYKNKKMFLPLEEYDDCNFVHGSLQTSLYKVKFEERTGLKVGRKRLIYFDCTKTDYELVETLDLEEEAKLILERRRVKGMKSIPVLLYGKSGSGKTASFRNYTKDELAYINILDKPLPFKSDIKINSLDTYESIIAGIKGTKRKTIFIDDAGFLMTNELFAKVDEKGYEKFTQIAKKFENLISEIKKIEGGKVVVFSMHEENNDGDITLNPAGKMVDNLSVIEGNVTIAIRSICANGTYLFKTKNTGKDVTKTPIGMFENAEIENDFKKVDEAIREYYELDKEEKKEEEK